MKSRLHAGDNCRVSKRSRDNHQLVQEADNGMRKCSSTVPGDVNIDVYTEALMQDAVSLVESGKRGLLPLHNKTKN